MVKNKRKVRSLVLRSYISSALFSFAVFTYMAVMFGFDLEDQIFDVQLNNAADALIENIDTADAKSGKTAAYELDYYRGWENLPPWLKSQINPEWTTRNLEIFGEERGHFHAAVRTLENGDRLYLVFNARPFVRSTPYIKLYLVVIGVMGGVILLISLFFMVRVTKKVSKPLETMAEALSGSESLSTQFDISNRAPKELHTLADAITDRNARIEELLEREQQFNRDASHELRTPLAVALGALEILEETSEKTKAFTRLKAAVQDMQMLTEGILWLGRDASTEEICNIYSACETLIASYSYLTGNRPITLSLEGEKDSIIPAPEPVALVMVGNLLRNALSYTEKGSVQVTVNHNSMTIIDTGIGFGRVDKRVEGFGVGLSLVKRLSDHFNLDFNIQAGETDGTTATLRWKEKADGI
ncbi:sensor histidine kinase [Kordiimonas laminariae]|uniref:sensor histidine kinase n=1 Tax=Kordiimonas laminariae TaxID=2917717 RepID=UPI001FF5C830|nr:HAMP domain-containing sensor histidine kinase [Kordiimonas laminariae]MCK0068993.1 HAMP domain-containing histidine kinase [Kordiimonas laminariae]